MLRATAKLTLGRVSLPLAALTLAALTLSALTLSSGAQAQVSRFGSPCARDGRIPALTASAEPRAGATFELRVDSGSPRNLALLLLGASNTRWGARTLPYDLTGLGFAGCRLLVSLDAIVGLTTDTSGAARLSLTLPPNTTGARAFAQAFARSKNARGQDAWGFSDGLALTVASTPPEHTVVALPDTQYYSQHGKWTHHFNAQTNWVVKNKTQHAISFVSHVGDLVQNGAQGTNRNATEWTRALAAMQPLDGQVRYGACIGNHDYDAVEFKKDAGTWLQHFGPGRYTRYGWYVGGSVDGLNHAQWIGAGKHRFLHLTLEWRPRDAALEWAQRMLTRFPTVPAIVTTHEYLRPGAPAIRSPKGHTPVSGGDNSGDDVYHKLVEPFPQVCFVTCGHIGGEGQLVTKTLLGRTVNQTLANYQFGANGGNGWLRLMRFRSAQSRIDVTTLSPTYVRGTTNGTDHSKLASSNFSLAYDDREHRGYLGAHRILRLRNGQDFGHGVYRGAKDTMVTAAQPKFAYGNQYEIFVDGNGDRGQGLLRFDGLVGTGRGQIRPRTRIAKAILTLTTEGPFAQSADGGKLYRMTADWAEASTYDSLGAGVQIGQETLATHDLDTKGQTTNTSTRSFDVTAAVQAWIDGTLANRGWLIQAGGNDGWGLRTSEWPTTVERPMLTVVY